MRIKTVFLSLLPLWLVIIVFFILVVTEKLVGAIGFLIICIIALLYAFAVAVLLTEFSVTGFLYVWVWVVLYTVPILYMFSKL